MAQRQCPRCGMQQTEWLGSDRQGVSKDGELYCCHGCAEESGCVCRTANVGSRPVAGDAGGETEGLMSPRDAQGRPLAPDEAAVQATQLTGTAPGGPPASEPQAETGRESGR